MPEKTNNANDAFKAQQKVAFLSILAELPNLAAQLALAVFSRSLIVALDTVDSASNFLQAVLSFSLSKKLQSDPRFKYDYGMGKIEAFGSLISALFLYVGLIAVAGVSIYSLINPTEPSKILFLAIFLKIINVSVDAYLLRKQIKMVKGISGSFVDSNTILLKKNLIFDSAALVTITASFAFRGVPAFSRFEPLMSLLFTGYIAFRNFKIVRDAASDLLDKTLDERAQLKVLKCVSTILADIGELRDIKTRRSGHIVYIDLFVSFDSGITYDGIYKTYKTFEAAVKEILPGSVPAIVIGGEENPNE